MQELSTALAQKSNLKTEKILFHTVLVDRTIGATAHYAKNFMPKHLALCGPVIFIRWKKKIKMIHGSWHWGGCFQKVADKLGSLGYAVSTPDMESHGYSEASWDSVASMETYTASARLLLEASPEPVILVGHSMGGVALSYLAAQMPNKIK